MPRKKNMLSSETYLKNLKAAKEIVKAIVDDDDFAEEMRSLVISTVNLYSKIMEMLLYDGFNDKDIVVELILTALRKKPLKDLS